MHPVDTFQMQVSTIQSDLGADRTNWEVLLEHVQGDGFTVIANAMNPKTTGALQTRERLYQIWYNHHHSKKHDRQFCIPDNSVTQALVDCDQHMVFLNLNMQLGLEMHHFLLPNNHPEVGKEAARLSAGAHKKAKQVSKPKKKPKGSLGLAWEMQEGDEDLEGDGKKPPKWHEVHEQVWHDLLGNHEIYADMEWTAEACTVVPGGTRAIHSMRHCVTGARTSYALWIWHLPWITFRSRW